MRSVLPLPLFACFACILSAAFVHADSFDGQKLVPCGTQSCAPASCAPAPRCAPKPCAMPRPCAKPMPAPCPKPCASPCGNPCNDSFRSSFYVGAYGGGQHAEAYFNVKNHEAGGSSAQGYDGACSGYVGLMAGYLHRFNDTRCAFAVEGFFEWNFVENEIRRIGNITNDVDIWQQELDYSFGGVIRPGYVLCPNCMLYAVLGAKYTQIKAHLKRVRNVPPPIEASEKKDIGLIYGIGLEHEFNGCHRIRGQITQTAYCDIMCDHFEAGAGMYFQTSTTTTELTLGYSYAF